ncbi:MAG: Ig-like domain-containing protein [Verrucomicrobiales bacterium]|nr:Ig-like domain-containing protein [Verrucomicrobiales bacterium]
MAQSQSSPVRRFQRWFPFVGAAVAMLWGVGHLSATAQSLQITGISLDGAGHPRIRHGGGASSYFVLLRGSELSDLTHAVDAQLGVQGSGELVDATPLRERAFYRVYQLPTTNAFDLDRDGMDDVFELTHSPALNPLNFADALGDADGDERNNLQEFEAGTDPLQADFFVIPSPQHQETGVSVNRETEFRFTVALAEGSTLDGSQIWAEAQGRRLLTRTELSGDRRTARLFYLEPVPGLTRVRVSMDGTGLRDALGRSLDLDSDGQPGGMAAIEFTTAALTPVAGTAVIGTVFASELIVNPTSPGASTNRPLAGVTITVDGAEETLRTTTDAQGRFTLTPCPAGRFFVHVDGRTVVDTAAGIQWPNQAYYPFVGKAWEATAGVMTNLAGGTGEIYLPLISSESLRGVSSTTETKVGFPAAVVAANPVLAGVEITVPPNALFADDGTRGGRVGMAPVDPARLPEPLPPGLSFPLVITVQTDGPQNFDQPVPVKFPNLPDPQTGKKLAPGEKSALWSFDHDKGVWEIVGPMTVSADGLYLVSDPGVGIRQPGWHGGNPGTGGGGPMPGPRKSPSPPRPPRPPLTPPSTPPPGPPPGPSPSPSPGPNGGGGDGDDSPIPDFPDLPDIPFIDEPESWGDLVSTIVDQLPTLGPDVFGPIVDIGKEGIEMFEDIGEVMENGGAVDSDGDGVPDVVESRDEFLNEIAEQAEDALPGPPDDADDASDMLAEWWSIWRELYGGSQNNLHSLRSRTGPSSPLEPPVGAVTHLAELKAEQADLTRLAWMQAAFEGYFQVLLGSNAWSSAMAAGVQFQDLVPVLRAATAAQQSGTDGGVFITAAEAGGILGFAAAATSWDPGTNLIVRMNDTVTENRRGRVLRSQGPQGSPDIIDAAEEQAATARLLEVINGEADAGYKNVGDRGKSLVSRMGQALGGFFGAYLPNAEVEPSEDNVFPVLLDIFPPGGDRAQQRLKTDTRGQLNGLRLPSDAVVAVRWLDPATMQVAIAFFTTGQAGSTFDIPQAVWNENSPTADADSDGLPDVAERIVGTLAEVPDSDGDGAMDGAEVRSGTNPLDGIVIQPGIVGAVDTSGQATDVAVETYDLSAFGGASSVTRLLVADGPAGIAVMEMINGQPVLLGRVDTPGDARRVALPASGTLLGDEVGLGAYADGAAGFGIVDLTDPVRPRLLHRLTPPGNTRTVTIHAGVVYAGTDGGLVQAVDIFSGELLDEMSLGYVIHDLKVYREALFVAGVSAGQVALQPVPLLPSGAFGTPGGATPSVDGTAARRGVRLVTGEGLATTIFGRGYSTWIITNLLAPQLVAPGISGQFGWFDLAPNGSGIAVACVGPNSTDDGPHDISVYDVRDPSRTDRFLETIVTPGMAVAVATHEALAYVADHEAGLQVVQYQASDRSAKAPQITVHGLANGDVVAGSRVSLEVAAVDDVAVKHVELWVNHQRVAQDHTWPYEFSFQAPTLSTAGSSSSQASLQRLAPARFNTNLIIQVRAVDTVGNVGTSPLTSLSLVADTTPPQVARVSPEADRVVPGDTPVIVAFDEPLDLATVTPTSVRVESSGADGVFGTADDTVLSGGTFSFLERANRVVLTFANRIPTGDYRIAVASTIRDASGNALGSSATSGFKVRDADLRGGGSFVGEGSFSSVGQRDVYGFQANAGQKLFFDVQLGASSGWRWSLLSPTGETVFRELAFFDVATVTLPASGRYELVIERLGSMDSGYRVQVWTIPSTPAFAIAIGDTVSEGQPAAGAGMIETPGVEDIYTFTATAGQNVFFDLQSGESGAQRWKLSDAAGTVVFNAGFFFDQAVVTLSRGGTYTLTIGNSTSDVTGSYRFRLWNVPGLQQFDIAIGDTVSDGVPGAGAGRIETPGVMDVYRFTAAPGQIVYFDLLDGASAATQWRVVDDAGQEVFTAGFFFDQGSIPLVKGGTYTLTVGNERTDFVGAYRFRLLNVPVAQRFNIAIGDTVSNGVPGAGAGNIETPGVEDVYTFTATPGQVVYFDLLSGGSAAIQWRLVDSTGAQVFQEGFFFDPGTVTLTNGGNYTLTIGNPKNDYVSTYSFRILNVPPPNVIPLALGDTVSNGIPAAGAGNIETPGALDVYTFTALAGQVVFFDLLEDGRASWGWRLVDETGVEVFNQGFFFDAGERTLTRGGTYTLTIGNPRNDATGTYRFQIRLVR